jgi:NADPH-dependent glutamate synthase beta subunit-like oxidoreductase
LSTTPSDTTRHHHAIAIVGGAVSGSEAAAIAAQRGALVVVIDQNERPFGKIEDGLPRWHVALRQKEYAKIGENLAHDNVLFVPRTRLGHELAWTTLTEELGFSAVILANGAWRDRPLPAALDALNGRGVAYQNPFVYWFNHQLDTDYRGPTFEIPDGAIVIGGGLASIDCVKIINFDLYGRALRARGIEVDAETMEHEGLPKVLADHGLTQADLGIQGATLFYRRRAEDMPLVSSDEGNAARMAKLEQTRVKLLTKVLEKYLVRFVPLASPVAPIVEGDRLVGVRFQRNAQVDGKLVATDEVFDVPTTLVVSSIGSIPEQIPGIPTRGELYVWRDWDSGRLDSATEVYGLGNVLTGKGNIVESRKNAKKVMGLFPGRLGVGTMSHDVIGEAHAAARAEAEPVIDQALALPEIGDEAVAKIRAWVAERWAAIGYAGDYHAWVAAHPPSA